MVGRSTARSSGTGSAPARSRRAADAVFDSLAQAPFTAYVVVMDLDSGPEVFPPREHAYFRSPEDVYAVALMFLAERFHHLLVDEDDHD